MNNTQQKSIIPLSEAICTATGSAQWSLERDEDAQTPIFHHNNLSVHICGEETFAKVSDDIQNARHSIDIICWGFDPAMELTRNKADRWPRGDTWGDLLRGAAQGKFSNGMPVQVRILVWHDVIGTPLTNNMPGYKRDASFELKAATRRGISAGLSPHGRVPPEVAPTEVRDQREVFNAHWYKDVVAGKIQGLALRMRGGVHADVVASLKGEASSKGLDAVERLGMEYLATHHQKTIVIDYEGDKPCGYVLGLNSVTDYWDTTAHKFDEPKRGKSWEGAGDEEPGLKPYQDYGCRIEGQALAAVCKNFTEAWNKAEAVGKDGKGAGSNLSRSFDLKAPPKNLSKNLVAPRQRAQILRTLPASDGTEKSIHRLYDQAASFARHYLYVENQYFQHSAWVSQLKQMRRDHLTGCQKGGLGMADVPKLHVMVVTPTPERAGMVPRTHDTVAELGYGSSMPNQSKQVEEELARYDAAMEAHKRDPYRTLQPQLSSIAQAYKDAGGGKDDETARKELEGQVAMRSLVASLWTFDTNWSSTQKEAWARLKEWTDTSTYDKNGKDISRNGERIKSLRDKLYKARYREIYIHSKLMIIDDSMFTLGSANLNLRSFAVDSEINIASDDAVTAKNLRQRVWAQHTDDMFSGGIATDQKVMFQTFQDWQKEADKNLKKKALGESPSCFLVAFHDDRTSNTRLG